MSVSASAIMDNQVGSPAVARMGGSPSAFSLARGGMPGGYPVHPLASSASSSFGGASSPLSGVVSNLMTARMQSPVGAAVSPAQSVTTLGNCLYYVPAEPATSYGDFMRNKFEIKELRCCIRPA